MDGPHFVYSFIGWCELELFPPLGYYEQCCYEHLCASFCMEKVFLSLGYILRNGIIPRNESYCKSMFNHWRNFQAVSKVAALFYVPTNSGGGFWFLHILAKCAVIWLLFLAFLGGGKYYLIMFWICISLMTMMESILSCVYYPSVYLPWRKSFVHFLNWITYLLFLSIRVPYIFRIQIPYQIDGLQIFSLIVSVVFLLFCWCSLKNWGFYFNEVQFIYSILYRSCFWCHT